MIMHFKKSLCVLLFLSIFFNLSANNTVKFNLDSLDNYISRQSLYVQEKENRIRQVRQEIARIGDDFSSQFPLYVNLFDEYKSYKYDSAYCYASKLLEISSKLKDNEKYTSAQVKLSFCYLSSGLFKEASDMLSEVDINLCDNETKINYYANKARLYYDLADYNKGEEFRGKYDKTGNQYLDSAIALIPEGTSRYWSLVGLKDIKSINYNKAIDSFQKMMETKDYSEHDLAIVTSSLGYIYRMLGKNQDAKPYLIQAVISDIKSATKETLALRWLSQLLYEEGDLNHAVSYIRVAQEDALFYNARQRQIELASVLPLMENDRIFRIEKQNKIMKISVAVVSGLFLILMIFFIVNLRKLSKLKKR